METKPTKILSPRNRNISKSTGLAKFNLSPKKPHLDNFSDAYGLKYEPPRLSHTHEAELERKASFHRARSIFDGSPVKKNDKDTKSLEKPTQTDRKPKTSSPFRPAFAVERAQENREVPEQQNQRTPSRNYLLSNYAAKQTKLADIERQKELLEFEIVEIEAQLQKSIGQDTFMDSIYAKANTEVNTLKNKVSTLFQSGADSLLLRKTASSIFNVTPDTVREASSFFSPKASKESPSSPLKKTASSIFTPSASFIPHNELKKKASVMLNNKFVTEVREKIDQQQNELEELTKKGTEFARNLISSFSPKKESRETFIAESSFMVDNLGNLSVIDRSVLLSDDEYEEMSNILDGSDQSVIHIDDYDSEDSEEDKENM